MRQVLALGSIAVLAGCGLDGPSDTSSATSEVRDSAGIRIVENAVPLWTSGEEWTMDPSPLVVLRASDGTEQNRLLDPTSVDVDSRGRIVVGDGGQVGWA